MIELKKIIAFDSMTYIVDLNAYDLHTGDEQISSMTLSLNTSVLHYKYDRGSLSFKVLVYLF